MSAAQHRHVRHAEAHARRREVDHHRLASALLRQEDVHRLEVAVHQRGVGVVRRQAELLGEPRRCRLQPLSGQSALAEEAQARRARRRTRRIPTRSPGRAARRGARREAKEPPCRCSRLAARSRRGVLPRGGVELGRRHDSVCACRGVSGEVCFHPGVVSGSMNISAPQLASSWQQLCSWSSRPSKFCAGARPRGHADAQLAEFVVEAQLVQCTGARVGGRSTPCWRQMPP